MAGALSTMDTPAYPISGALPSATKKPQSFWTLILAFAACKLQYLYLLEILTTIIS